MKSQLPKVLHSLGGQTLVEWVLNSCLELNPTRQLVIVGYQGDRVQDSLKHLPNLQFVEQKEQLGTGHAVQQLIPYLQGFNGDVLVLNGDVPLLGADTLKNLLTMHKQHNNAATILTANVPNPKGYGRVFCDGQNFLKQIVEDRDCSPAQKQNRRVNAGVYCFRWSELEKALPKLEANNDQKEYYLTDVVNFLHPVMAVDVEDYQEILGINDRKQLAQTYAIVQEKIKDSLMKAGITLIDPESVTIDHTVKISPDVII
ncbi:MAG TPA: sugar phosphate nucleotidyltransferase, partial [Allocoleopsis sp.]